MEDKLKIKISIADRVYPLTIHPSQEEGLRSASKKIDLMITQFEQNYAVRDKQDVLAMCALQFANQSNQTANTNSEVQIDNFLEKVSEINQKIEAYLL